MKNVLRGGILDKLMTTSFQNVTLFLILMTALISPLIALSFPNAMNDTIRLKCDWSGCAKVENQFMDIWTKVWKQIEPCLRTYLFLKELEI